jgi:hypothetical protein
MMIIIHRVNEEKNILRTIRKRKTNWIGHILRRNCLLKHVLEGKIEGRIEVTGRRGRCKRLLDDINLLPTEFYFNFSTPCI